MKINKTALNNIVGWDLILGSSIGASFLAYEIGEFRGREEILKQLNTPFKRLAITLYNSETDPIEKEKLRNAIDQIESN